MPRLLNLVDYTNPNSFGSRLRRRRFQKILRAMDSVYAQKGSLNIIDLGGTPAYWAIFGLDRLASRYPNIHITLVNSDSRAGNLKDNPLFSFTAGDACDLSRYADNSFDFAHSNSTIEHVGSWERMNAFARETRRLAPAYYLQTPYFWFPLEPHLFVPFFHWLPECWRVRFLLAVQLGYHQKAKDVGEAMTILHNYKLLDKKQLSYLLPDAKIEFEWFAAFPKSLIAIKGE